MVQNIKKLFQIYISSKNFLKKEKNFRYDLNFFKIKSKNGFTIVELLVTSVIFALIFGSAIGIFVQAIRLQKYNLSHQELLNQTGYAMEYIARALRMAQTDDGTCGFNGQNYNITDSGARIFFKNKNGICQSFYWHRNNGQIYVSGGGFSSDLPLTSDSYELVDLRFVKYGDINLDFLQPRVTFFMKIRDRSLKDKPQVIIQTTVSQRNLDINIQ